jgi:UDP-glucose 4-epimerase
MNVLVTGGVGFIGSHIVSKLVSLSHNVFVIDNFHTGSKENLKHDIDKIKIFEGNVGKVGDFNLPKIDTIIHCGMYSSTPMYRKNPTLVSEVINDAIGLFEFAKNNNSKVVIASSSSIYNSLSLPWKEDMQPVVTDLYTEARIGVERLAKLYHDWHGLNVVILRFFSVYGSREESKKNFANNISQFIWNIIKDKPPVIYGDGTQTRDFTFIDDTVRAVILAMNSDLKFEIINIGSGTKTSFNEIIKIINNKLGKNVQSEYVENPLKNYVSHTLADTQKAKELLDFEAEFKLEDGIEKTIEYYKTLSNLPYV